MSSDRTVCPFCPGSTRLFSQHGLKIHIGRKHKNVPSQTALSQPVVILDPTIPSSLQLPSNRCTLDNLSYLKNTVPVLRHIPKGARCAAAEQLVMIIKKCLSSNSVEDWGMLLTFAYRALRIPSKSESGNLTQKVKENIYSAGDTTFPEDPGILGPAPRTGSLYRTIESKVHEGDLKAAVRLLMSDDTVAKPGPETLNSLRSKHPSPSRSLLFPEDPYSSVSPLSVKCEDVALALTSFNSGSAAGLDGLRPCHLKELVSISAGDNGLCLLQSLTDLVNFLLGGQVNSEVCAYLYGASMCALRKKDGGIRPIAIGSTFRRLAAKLACRAVKEGMAEYLQPHQLGFGTRLGCEAAIHATRAFVTDQSNHDKVGAQQGDPLGPLTFSLGIHRAISDLRSPLNVWYLDDGVLGGSPEQVKGDLQNLISRFGDLGLKVNADKCEFFPCSPEASRTFPDFNSFLPGVLRLTPLTFNLLGSPIFPDAIPEAIEQKKHLLAVARSRVANLSAHTALVLLRMCLAVPKVVYLLRTAPTWLYSQQVAEFDDVLKETVQEVLNVSLGDSQWTLASLPVRFGGLGVRRMGDVGLPAFLASANGVVDLVTKILPFDGDGVIIPFAADACIEWRASNPGVDLPRVAFAQRMWDEVSAKRLFGELLSVGSAEDAARLRAAARPESGAWLQALPSPHLGTLLDNDSLRVAVALRLGCNICEPHVCICGSTVGADGHHALACCRCSGRFPRHHALNDIIRRALISANVPCVLEPPGLCRTDGKRPDGLTLVPWERGRCLLWDATCVSTFAKSHIARSSREAGSAAEVAATKKRDKYSPLLANYMFVPFAVETAGSWAAESISFVREIGHRLRDRGLDYRSGSYLVQRLAIAIQRGNAASILGSFAPGTIRGGLFD